MNRNDYRKAALRTEGGYSNFIRFAARLSPVQPPLPRWRKNAAFLLQHLASRFMRLQPCPATFEEWRLLHASLGLCSELAEYENAYDHVNRAEEIGDLFWYLAVARDATLTYLSLGNHLEPKELMEIGEHNPLLAPGLVKRFEWRDGISELADLMKKRCFYGKRLVPDHLWRLVDAIEEHLCSRVAERERDWGTEGQIRARNIAKLRKRYPEKFSNDLALDRDLCAERKVLEGK